MKRAYLYIILGVTLIMGVAQGCSKEEIPLYSGPSAGIYIQYVANTDTYGNPVRFNDSISFSFANFEDTKLKGSVRFPVQLMGELSDKDRPFVIEIDKEQTTAIEGVDFEFDPSNCVLKAGEGSTLVPVTLLRTPKLLKNTLRIVLRLKSNEYFETNLEGFKSNPSWSVESSVLDATLFKVSFSEKYKAPMYWRFFGKEYFGDFTAARYLTLNKVMGWTTEDWDKAGQGGKVGGGRFEFAARELQKYLQDLADKGTPLYNDDGSYLTIGDKYPVDYSKLPQPNKN